MKRPLLGGWLDVGTYQSNIETLSSISFMAQVSQIRVGANLNVLGLEPSWVFDNKLEL